MARDPNSMTSAPSSGGSQGGSSGPAGGAAQDFSSLPLASRSKLLDAKFAILNREFVEFLATEVENDAEVDLTTTCESYTANVMNLRRMYKVFVAKDDDDPAAGGVRRVKKAKRRFAKDGGDASEQQRKLSETPKPKAPAPTAPSSTPAPGAGTSSGFGGFGSTGTKTTFPSSSASSASTGTAPVIKASTPAFGSATPRMDMSADLSAITSSPAPATFLFGAAAKKQDADGTLTATVVAVPTPSAAGGGGRKRAIRGGGPDGGSESVVFRGGEGGGSSDSSVKPFVPSIPPVTFTLPKANPNFWNSPKPDVDKKKDLDKPEETKGEKDAGATSSILKPDLFSSATKTAPFAFGSFGSTTKAPSTGAAPLTFPSFSSSAPLSFPSFSAAPKAPADGGEAAAEGEEEGEYVPPKAEVVANEEPGATISVKCALFKLVEKNFEKIGVGMLHVKETDGKKSLLIRAATSTGTIWANARLDSSLKAERAADDKIRFSTPVSPTEIKTFLVRVGNKDEATKIFEAMQSAGAK